MILNLRDKINLENIKSSAQNEITNIAKSVFSNLLSTVKNIGARLLQPVTSAISFISRTVGAVKSATAQANQQSFGDPSNILDPARDKIFDVMPALPKIPTEVPKVGSEIQPILVSTLSQVSNLGTGALQEIYSLFENISKNLQGGENEVVAPEDNVTDVAGGLPDTNEIIRTSNQGILNTKKIKQTSQLPTIEGQIQSLNELGGSTIGEKKYIRKLITGLAASSDVYKEALQSPYAQPVSDQVGLATLGHTVDTMALDSEDWGKDPTIKPDGRLIMGPAQIFPKVTEYKVSRVVAEQMQQAYISINNKMHLTNFKDRYYTNSPTVYFNYPISKFQLDDKPKYGFKTGQAVSHTNMGDYASLGFALISDTSVEELNNLQVPNELIELIGYLYNVNNFNVIEQKPVYEVDIKGVKILIDSRGNRFLSPASAPDNTSVRVS